MTQKVTVAAAIRYLRERKGMSARAVSLAAGLSPSYVSKVESNQMEPSFRAFCKIAAVLEMTEREVLFLVKETLREV